MRPKKIILCIDQNEQDLSVLKFLLFTNGYRAETARTAHEALSIAGELQVDLVLADQAVIGLNGRELAGQLKDMAPAMPVLLMGDPRKPGIERTSADAIFAKRVSSSMELLEKVKLMSARKRGPRKGTVRVVPPMQLAKAG